MTLRTARKMSRKFLRNRRGTAEVIGSILFIVIVIFFFSNVYLWHDQATKQMNTVLSNKMNSLVSITAIDGGLSVSNEGGVEVTLSRLWIIDGTQHFYADLENITGGSKIMIQGGQTKQLELDTSAGHLDPVAGWDLIAQTARIQYTPLSSSITCRILTTNGNTASCQYVSGAGASAQAVTVDPESFKYYALGVSGNPSAFDVSASFSGYSIASGSSTVFAVNLTNRDPNGRSIELSINSQLFFLNTTNATNSFAFYIVSADGNQPTRTVLSAYSTIPLQHNVPTTVYFASATPSNFMPEIVQSQGINQRIFTVNLVLLGTIGGNQFGQSIPFVSAIR
jgi:hypothetical protein